MKISHNKGECLKVFQASYDDRFGPSLRVHYQVSLEYIYIYILNLYFILQKCTHVLVPCTNLLKYVYYNYILYLNYMCNIVFCETRSKRELKCVRIKNASSVRKWQSSLATRHHKRDRHQVRTIIYLDRPLSNACSALQTIASNMKRQSQTMTDI